MKIVHVLRHGEANGIGHLTDSARELARRKGEELPLFTKVVSSGAPRATETALFVANIHPLVDERAGFFVPVEEHTRLIAQFAMSHSVDFVEAAYLYKGGEFADGMDQQAGRFNDLVDEVLEGLGGAEQALIVSHSTTIVPAIAGRLRQPRVPLDHLQGYQILGNGQVVDFL